VELSVGWREILISILNIAALEDVDEELHNLYASPNLIRMRWAGHVECMGAKYVQYSGWKT
jgi:hypothetical protein